MKKALIQIFVKLFDSNTPTMDFMPNTKKIYSHTVKSINDQRGKTSAATISTQMLDNSTYNSKQVYH